MDRNQRSYGYSEDPELRRLQMITKFEEQARPPKWLSLICMAIGIWGLLVSLWEAIKTWL